MMEKRRAWERGGRDGKRHGIPIESSIIFGLPNTRPVKRAISCASTADG